MFALVAQSLPNRRTYLRVGAQCAGVRHPARRSSICWDGSCHCKPCFACGRGARDLQPEAVARSTDLWYRRSIAHCGSTCTRAASIHPWHHRLAQRCATAPHRAAYECKLCDRASEAWQRRVGKPYATVSHCGFSFGPAWQHDQRCYAGIAPVLRHRDSTCGHTTGKGYCALWGACDAHRQDRTSQAGAVRSIKPALREFRRVLLALGCSLLSVYRQTEARPNICQTAPQDDLVDKTDTAGKPLWNVEVRIADPLGGAFQPLGATG